ncbi:methyltransferase [Streptomyces sp. NPDC052701]|uniref:methyltransferase n=1 Tax=Streptomyces sp. NPDC052701 TaxID=3155533 RepID=UPI00344A6F90
MSYEHGDVLPVPERPAPAGGRQGRQGRLRSYERSLNRSRQSRSRSDRPKEFRFADRDWTLLDEVFAPLYSPSTEVALGFLGLADAPAGGQSGSFLEIGCGSGVIAVLSALAGRTRVVAADINPRAVENTAVNADRHGVRLRAVHSDLFSGVGDERFDTIFWSSNYVLAPEDYLYRSLHEYAYVDPGYRAHRRYLTQAPDRLAPGGAALLHFSGRGDIEELHRIAGACGRELRTVRRTTVLEGEYGDDLVEHLLLQIH